MMAGPRVTVEPRWLGEALGPAFDINRPDIAKARLEEILGGLRPGQACCYHEGDLLADRQGNWRIDLPAEWIARSARRLHLALAQQRLGEGRARYLAIRQKGRAWS